jgi:hypothetical protein
MSAISPMRSPGPTSAFWRRRCRRRPSVEDDVGLLAGAPLVGQLGAGLGVELLGELGDAPELVVGEPLEEGNLGEAEGSVGRVRAGHAGSP